MEIVHFSLPVASICPRDVALAQPLMTQPGNCRGWLIRAHSVSAFSQSDGEFNNPLLPTMLRDA